MFLSSLRRVLAAVHATFDSDAQLQAWLNEFNSGPSELTEEAGLVLNRFLSNLESGWVSSMLINEDRSEESGVIAEAVMAEIRAVGGDSATRKVFAYQLASRIVNQGIRPLNRSAKRLEPHPAIDAFAALATPELSLPSELDCERYDRAVEALLAKASRSNEVATPQVTMAVKQVWEEAMRAVDAELGGAKAKPMSAAVKQKIAERLQLPLTTVEAAMKRYQRAVRRVRSAEIDARVNGIEEPTKRR